jgi:heme A synthase
MSKTKNKLVILPALGIIFGGVVSIFLFIVTNQVLYVGIGAGIGLIIGSLLLAMQKDNPKSTFSNLVFMFGLILFLVGLGYFILDSSTNAPYLILTSFGALLTLLSSIYSKRRIHSKKPR